VAGALYRTIDAQGDAISATDVDSVGDRGLEALRRASDTGIGMLAAAVATGKQERFVAACYRVHECNE
jgi:hypothetical protein